MQTVAVTINADLCTGLGLANGTVRFTLTRLDVDIGVTPSALLLPAPEAFRLDVNGVAVVQRWPNTRGTQGTQYLVEFFDAFGVRLAVLFAAIPQTDCDLADVLNLQPPPVVNDAQAAALAAQAYAAQAYASALQVSTVLFQPSNFDSVMRTWFNGLPTVLPGSAGAFWNNGGVLSQS